MSPQAHFIVQDVIAREHDPRPAAEALGARFTQLKGDPRGEILHKLDQEIREREDRPILFCSLHVAGWTRRFTKRLAAGVDLPDAFLRHGNYTPLIPRDWRLNREGIYLPWGMIPERAEMLMDLYGDHLFIRPDSSLKPFPGFDIAKGRLVEEHRLRNATDHVDPGEMCFIAPALEIEALEYRAWVIEGQVVSIAPYSWTDAHLGVSDIPEVVAERAAALARHIELHRDCYTADFTVHEGEPRLVELNALSTSGWYPRADILSVFRAADAVFL